MRNYAIITGIVLGLFALLAAPSVALAGTIVVESFETYSNDGTTGYWELPENGWDYTAGSPATDYEIMGSSYATEGDQALGLNFKTSYSNSHIQKTFSDANFTQGGFDVHIYTIELHAANFGFLVEDSDGVAFLVVGLYAGDSGDPNLYTGPWNLWLNSESVVIGSVGLDTAVHVDYEVDVDTAKVRARMNSGSWTDWQDYKYAPTVTGAADVNTLEIRTFRMEAAWDNLTGVPEPMTLSVLALGGLGWLMSRRRRA